MEATIKKGLHLEISSDLNPPEIGIKVPELGRTLSRSAGIFSPLVSDLELCRVDSL